jgi:hypothetical protein
MNGGIAYLRHQVLRILLPDCQQTSASDVGGVAS